MTDVTQLLQQIEAGDAQAAEQLLPLVYAELRRLAARRLMQEKPGQTLDATGLVHEVYLKLAGGASPQSWQGRNHFFNAAAEAMRRILVDKARRKRAVKHGGGRARVDLDADCSLASHGPSDALLALDEALDRLAEIDPEKAKLVKLRYFAGLTTREAAEAIGVSVASAERYWTFARSWLYAELNDGDAASPTSQPLPHLKAAKSDERRGHDTPSAES